MKGYYIMQLVYRPKGSRREPWRSVTRRIELGESWDEEFVDQDLTPNPVLQVHSINLRFYPTGGKKKK